MVKPQPVSSDRRAKGITVGVRHAADRDVELLKQLKGVEVNRRVAPVILEVLYKRRGVRLVPEMIEGFAQAEQLTFVQRAEGIVVADVDGLEKPLAPQDGECGSGDREVERFDDRAAGGLDRGPVARGDCAIEIDHQSVETVIRHMGIVDC